MDVPREERTMPKKRRLSAADLGRLENQLMETHRSLVSTVKELSRYLRKDQRLTREAKGFRVLFDAFKDTCLHELGGRRE
jgi:hypothetical protein